MLKTTKKFAVGALSAAMAVTMLLVTPAMAKTTKTVKTPAQVKILAPKLVQKTHVQVRWNKAKNASKYRVYYKVGSGKWAAANVSGKTTAYTTKSLGYSKTVSVKVAGLAGSKKGKASATKVIKTAAKSSSKKTTADYAYNDKGQKIYVGKTYDTSYWGDTLSHRKIKVTEVDQSCPNVKLRYGVSGVDVVNGGSYHCTFLTKANTDSTDERYEQGYRFGRSTYNKRVTKFNKNGLPVFEDPERLCGGAFKYYGAGKCTLLIHIWQKDVTIYETTDGTLPSPTNYFRKYTAADGEVKTYDWCDGKGGYQRIAAYAGNQEIFEMNQTVLAS
jgi:hypothetical protein